MNVFFRAGELLPNFRIQSIYSALLSVLCFSMFSLSAQTPRRDSGADGSVKINPPAMLGFRLPQEFWSHEFTVYENNRFSKQTLAQYRGKPLILDFWATWCTSCVRNFPKLDHFKKTYGDSVNFLLVNSFDRDTAKIAAVFTDDKFKNYRTNIPTIVWDDYLKELFPHQAVPIYIWIDDYGYLAAISTADFVNDNQIKVLLDRMKGGKQ